MQQHAKMRQEETPMMFLFPSLPEYFSLFSVLCTVTQSAWSVFGGTEAIFDFAPSVEKYLGGLKK